MDEGETKICENCKREIPAVNFTTHAVHCTRNIRMCPVCKEPVPHADLQQHHDKMHKLLACKQCGESVCGTDMEDHIRDSCAHTMKCCRFCLLELRRGALPPHERYCGARTELCACGEWVMHKYRQLHLDSNHGFVRLHDDPEPIKSNINTNNVHKVSNVLRPTTPPADIGHLQSGLQNVKNINTSCPIPNIRRLSQPEAAPLNTARTTSTFPNGAVPSQSGSGSQPHASQSALANKSRVNTEIQNAKLNMGLSNVTPSIGGSGPGAAGDPGSGSSAQNGAIPRSRGIGEKVQVNTATAPLDRVKNNLWASRGAVKKRPAPKPPGPAAAEPPADQPCLRSALQRRQQEDEQRREQTARNLLLGLPPVLSAADKLDKLRQLDALQHQHRDHGTRPTGRGDRPAQAASAGDLRGHRRNDDLKNLKPMTPQEFMDRFDRLQLMKEPSEERLGSGDRFGQIKSSLTELRRGLSEATAPYGCGERLPCEFCGAPVPAERLVLHQTGCRPDLARYQPRASPPARVSSPTRAPSPAPPVIPCEFCTAPLPLYLLSEHQERCGRDKNLLFPD